MFLRYVRAETIQPSLESTRVTDVLVIADIDMRWVSRSEDMHRSISYDFAIEDFKRIMKASRSDVPIHCQEPLLGNTLSWLASAVSMHIA
ncbi:hypothetical protein NLI96_g5366 [Meripilus lineatus]|uniref:Uncharacterized protein n=1 Tax=Meripilus lineatus TaxID=2056292 RepID=A0AAD5V2Z6_9APHY|nr:hypothetical protein NLI96_g5366 [Physisporinus lineatus]